MRITFDISRPINSRVTRLKLRCQNCVIPRYEAVNYSRIYRVIMPSYLADGGDGYEIILANKINHIQGDKDVDVFKNYISKVSPIVQGFDERIIFEDQYISFNEETHYNSSSTNLSNLYCSFLVWIIMFQYIL